MLTSPTHDVLRRISPHRRRSILILGFPSNNTRNTPIHEWFTGLFTGPLSVFLIHHILLRLWIRQIVQLPCLLHDFYELVSPSPHSRTHSTARQSPLSPYFAWPGCGASRQRGMLSRSRPSPEKIFALLEPCLREAPGALDCARVPKFCEAVQDEG